MFDTVIQLLENFSFVLVIVYIYTYVRKHFERYPFYYHAGFIGFIFTSIAILAMQRPIEILEGITIDARVIIICLSGYFGGPISAAIAATLVAIYRASMGGIGSIAGIVSILISGFVGSIFFFQKLRFKKNESRAL